MSPEAVETSTGPVTPSIRTSPEAVEALTMPVTSSMSRSPDLVSRTRAEQPSTVMSPEAETTWAFSAWLNSTSPERLEILQSRPPASHTTSPETVTTARRRIEDG